MKKWIAVLLAALMLMSLMAACSANVTINEDDDDEKKTETTKDAEGTTAPKGTEDATAPEATTPDTTAPSQNGENEYVEYMSYAEYMAAEMETEVTVLCYVQATQSWWEDKITVYAADEDGAYFIYELACTQEEAAGLTTGAPILVSGVKTAWAGEVEIVDATFCFVEGLEGYVAVPKDLTALLGSEEMINYQNQTVVFRDMTVKEISFKNGGGDDIYVTLTKDGNDYSFCVEVYLTGTDTDIYTTTAALQAGDVVDIGCFLYWYEGMNPHIIDINVK